MILASPPAETCATASGSTTEQRSTTAILVARNEKWQWCMITAIFASPHTYFFVVDRSKEIGMTTAFTGNGAYCYANGLHMMLLAAGADPTTLPEPNFLECATAMPFGRGFYAADGPTFWPSAPGWSPEKGLDQAINVLGWRCRTWYGGGVEEAIGHLRDGLRLGSVLIGPVDFGYLSYSPASRHMAGADHYVMALALEQDHVVVHDPAGYPYAVLPMPDFLEAWQAEHIGYRQGQYTLRSCFREERQVARMEFPLASRKTFWGFRCRQPRGVRPMPLASWRRAASWTLPGSWSEKRSCGGRRCPWRRTSIGQRSLSVWTSLLQPSMSSLGCSDPHASWTTWNRELTGARRNLGC